MKKLFTNLVLLLFATCFAAPLASAQITFNPPSGSTLANISRIYMHAEGQITYADGAFATLELVSPSGEQTDCYAYNGAVTNANARYIGPTSMNTKAEGTYTIRIPANSIYVDGVAIPAQEIYYTKSSSGDVFGSYDIAIEDGKTYTEAPQLRVNINFLQTFSGSSATKATRLYKVENGSKKLIGSTWQSEYNGSGVSKLTTNYDKDSENVYNAVYFTLPSDETLGDGTYCLEVQGEAIYFYNYASPSNTKFVTFTIDSSDPDPDPTPEPVPFTFTVAGPESPITEISEITLTGVAGTTLAQDATKGNVTLTGANNSVYNAAVSVSGNVATLTFNPAITAADTYTLSVPEGRFYYTADGVNNPNNAVSGVQYTIEAAQNPDPDPTPDPDPDEPSADDVIAVITTNPASGSTVSSVGPQIQYTTDQEIEMSYEGQMPYVEGISGSEAYIYRAGIFLYAKDGNPLTITEDGTYKIVFPAGSLLVNDNATTKDFVITYYIGTTPGGEDPDPDPQDPEEPQTVDIAYGIFGVDGDNIGVASAFDEDNEPIEVAQFVAEEWAEGTEFYFAVQDSAGYLKFYTTEGVLANDVAATDMQLAAVINMGGVSTTNGEGSEGEAEEGEFTKQPMTLPASANGQDVVFTYNVAAKSLKATWTVQEPQPQIVAVSVDPANLAQVDQISAITVSCEGKSVARSEIAATQAYVMKGDDTYTFDSIVVAPAADGSEITEVVLSFNNALTEAGQYSVYFPEGFFTVDNSDISAAIDMVITVKSASSPEDPQDPELPTDGIVLKPSVENNGEYSIVDDIKIEFDGYDTSLIEPNPDCNDAITIDKADHSNNVSYVCVYSTTIIGSKSNYWDVENNCYKFTPNYYDFKAFIRRTEITEAGEYVLHIPEAFFMYTPASRAAETLYTPELDINFTVNPSAEQTTGIESIFAPENGMYNIYNIQGVKVMEGESLRGINNLPAGLYIVNGKKFIVR